MRSDTEDLDPLGLFDPLALHDFREQVQAAYTAGLEEQFAQELYSRASNYNVVPEGGKLRIVLLTSGEFCVIEGLLILGHDGKTFPLVETARMIDRKVLEGVGDPDAYRVLVDLTQEAFEGMIRRGTGSCGIGLDTRRSSVARRAVIRSLNAKIVRSAVGRDSYHMTWENQDVRRTKPVPA